MSRYSNPKRTSRKGAETAMSSNADALIGDVETFLRTASEQLTPETTESLRQPGLPRVLPALCLRAGLLVCVLSGFNSQLALWRLLSSRGPHTSPKSTTMRGSKPEVADTPGQPGRRLLRGGDVAAKPAPSLPAFISLPQPGPTVQHRALQPGDQYPTALRALGQCPRSPHSSYDQRYDLRHCDM